MWIVKQKIENKRNLFKKNFLGTDGLYFNCIEFDLTIKYFYL